MYAQGLQLARQAQRLSGNSFAAVHLIKAYALVPMRLYKDAKYELQAFLSREPKGNSAQQAQTLLAEVEAALPASASAHP
jgi:TolA-binding protein